ncbi:MAG: hypothetical protein P4L64_08470 [Caulobacteraceae bacterium]|nr:hypothetical protein [Caulobacteraceae bacterium]
MKYEPRSAFLKAVIAESVTLAGTPAGEANLQRLIALTSDRYRSNRDWAIFLLAQEDVDTPQVRQTLLLATRDKDEFCGAEAILGLAKRAPDLALPLVQAALSGPGACPAIFEAAEHLAHPSLIEDLRAFTAPSDHAYADYAAQEALAACERALEHQSTSLDAPHRGP